MESTCNWFENPIFKRLSTFYLNEQQIVVFETCHGVEKQPELMYKVRVLTAALLPCSAEQARRYAFASLWATVNRGYTEGAEGFQFEQGLVGVSRDSKAAHDGTRMQSYVSSYYSPNATEASARQTRSLQQP